MGMSGCVQLKTLSLYDTEEVQAPIDLSNIAEFAEPAIYRDATRDMWGLEKDECKHFQASNNIYRTGKTSIHLNWDRYKCDWVGVGIGWNGWAAKDLSDIFQTVGIEMYIRAPKGKKMYMLPMVMILEDYSGVQTYSYTHSKFLEEGVIGEEWVKVVVPLNSFDAEDQGIDLTNIKQLVLELQQVGELYIDDISLVPYKPFPITPWVQEKARPNPTLLPISLFKDEFINNHEWGFMEDQCQTIEISSKDKTEGSKSVHAKWDHAKGDCHFISFGINWNEWHPIDATELWNDAIVQFKVKNLGEVSEKLNIRLRLEAYNFSYVTADIDKKFSSVKEFGKEWTTVEVPFSAFQGQIDKSQLKQLIFDFGDEGEVYIDEIYLINKGKG